MTDTTASTAGTPMPKWEREARDEVRAAVRKFNRPLQDLVKRDANEGDTRLLVTDMLCAGLGYDKYEDLTTEFAVRGEFADYGVRIDKQLVSFIEVKRAAQKLNVRHLRQVETYAVKEGLEWMILTNGQVWQLYHTSAITGQPVATHLVLEVDVLGDAPLGKKTDQLFYFHKAALKRERVAELWRRKAATSPAAMATVLQCGAVLDSIRKEIRRGSNYNADTDELARILRGEVIRPELLLP